MTQSTNIHQFVTQTRASLKQIGYLDNLLLSDYGFSDFLTPSHGSLTIPLAAFAQEPTSYKTACFGVIQTTSDDPREVESCRALGAPIVLALQNETNICRIWKMMAQGMPQLRGDFPANRLLQEIIDRQEQWQPKEVLRAKNIAFPQVSPQLDFYDIGLIPAIEAEVYRKLNELLGTVVAQAKEVYQERYDTEPDYRVLFQLIFRFIAAKLLGDRKHPGDWLNPNAAMVLQSVNAFYFSNPIAATSALDAAMRNRIWDTIRTAFQFQNLSVEALAYVYENTFVDLPTRRALGTHATPYEIAEYIVRALPVETLPQDERIVFEPFCGAAPFLIAALGRLRELLPGSMNASERHQYFVRMLSGMELDPFAREVALYSLILADYPNSNGWQILEEDVFASPRLPEKMRQANIVLCNPPYGEFSAQEKDSYTPNSATKASEALQRVLENPPKMLGFVLPRVFVNGLYYRKALKKLQAQYGCIDIVALPDTVFQRSSIETVLLVAYNNAQGTIRRRFRALSKPDYQNFRNTRTIEWHQEPLKPLWEELEGSVKFSAVAEVHRGIEYNVPFQTNYSRLVSNVEKPGFTPGLVRVKDGFQPFVVPDVKYLNTDESLMLYLAYKRQWNVPKLIAPAGRMSSDRWIICSAADYDGLICTQRFYGIWPKVSALSLEVLAAVLNGPVANAWLSCHRTGRDIQSRYVSSIPIPEFSPTAIELITRYVDRYIRLHGTAGAMDVLMKIDAAVLDAYKLSGEAETELLAWFADARRPGVDGFTGYGSEFEQVRDEYRREIAHFQQVERYQDLVEKNFHEELTPAEIQERDRLSQHIDGYNEPFYMDAPHALSHKR